MEARRSGAQLGPAQAKSPGSPGIYMQEEEKRLQRQMSSHTT